MYVNCYHSLESRVWSLESEVWSWYLHILNLSPHICQKTTPNHFLCLIVLNFPMVFRTQIDGFSEWALYSVHLYTAQCTPARCTAYTSSLLCSLLQLGCTMWTVCCVLHTMNCTVQAVHCKLNSVNTALYTYLLKLYSVHSALVHCTIETVLWTLCPVHHTIENVHWWQHSVNCALRTVHCAQLKLHTPHLHL